MKKLMIAGAALIALAGPASAAVLVTTTTSGTNPAADPGFGSQTLLYDFDGNNPGGLLTGNFTIFSTPSGTSQSAAPAGTTVGTNFLSVPNPSSTGTATLLLGGEYTSASFYWGSIDDYNTVDVLGTGGVVLATFTGLGLPVPTAANGNQAAPTSNRRVNFSTDGAGITGFRMTSTQFAFETDTYAVGAAVPEPATWAMMIGGFGLVGGAMRRSRSFKTVTA